jgi:hypothetical protein
VLVFSAALAGGVFVAAGAQLGGPNLGAARLVPRVLAAGGCSSVEVPRFLYLRSTPRMGRKVPSSALSVAVRGEGHCSAV